MMDYLASQFGRPRGMIGAVVGWLMASKNAERTRWTIALLEIQRRDQVLEVGFGPGVGVQLAAALAADGWVAGVDHSEIMLRAATQRSAAAIGAGRVELRQGSVASLAYPDSRFDKVYAINSLRFWPAPVENLREIRRVMKPGGRLAITEQPMGAEGEAEVPRWRQTLSDQLAAAGFQPVRLETRFLRPATCVCALGTK
jgi:ubiquinone/menaquinone biosynthesis C-methylase UbiE